MQPKFTQKSLGSLCFKNIAIALIFIASTQLSIAQPAKGKQATTIEKAALILKAIERNNSGAGINADNDAGLPNRVSQSINRTEAICTTFTGSLGPGDPTLAGNRFFRDGVASTCAAPKAACPGLSAPSGCFYDMYTWTNPIGSAQCVTITFTNNTTGFVNFISAYIGAPNPANICANYLADIGGSPALGTPGVFSFTAPGGATIGFLVTSVTAGTPSNYSFTLDAAICSGTPCSGTPTPGNTISSANPVCPNVSFTLATQTPPASGYTFQWQSSLTGVPASFTNITGATGSTFTTSQTVATFYRAIVTCGANTATSAPLQITMNGFNSCYCSPIYTNACALGDYIANVKLGTLNNTSVCTGQFTYYSAVPAPDVFVGVTNTLTVSVGPDTFGQFVGAWIDFNQDGIFSPSEFLATPVNAGASGTVNYTFTVPATATLGTTRMRIRGGDDAAMTSAMACGASNSTFGEAEDYNVNITPCVQGVITVQPANTSAQCSGNATFTVTATGSSLAYGWEYRINASSPWLNVPNAAPYSGVTTNTLTITNASSTINGYQYRAYMQGPCTATDFSAPATLTVTPLVAAVSPASATICVGSIQQLTLTNASSPTTATFSSGPLSVQIPDFAGPPASSAAVCNAGINHTIPVTLPVGSIITRIDVRLNITHTYVGDLIIVLRGPNNQILNLDYHKSGTGTGGANFTNTVFSSAGVNAVGTGTAPGYTGLWRADAAIGAGSFGDATGTGPTGFAPTVTTFNGIWTVPSGNWTIAMCDPQEWAGDIGTLTSWSMDITYGAPAAGVWTASPAAPNTMFTNAAATTPYVAGSLANTIWVNPIVNTSYSVVYSTATPCTSAATVVPVTVVTPISAVVNPVNRAACVGGSTTFTASATGGPLTYQWQVSNDGGLTWTNISGATSASYTVGGATVAMHNTRYRAVISASPCAGAGGSVSTTAATLTVNSLPTVTISAPDLSLTPPQTTTITGTSSPAAASWSWTLNGSAITGVANTQSVNINGLGVYQARVTDVNGCVSTSNSLTIGPEASDRLWIYPNPNDGVFQVRLYYGSPVTEKRVVSIYKSNGQLVTEKEFTIDNVSSPYLRMDFDLSTLAGGTYVVKVNNRHTGIIVSGLVVIQ